MYELSKWLERLKQRQVQLSLIHRVHTAEARRSPTASGFSKSEIKVSRQILRESTKFQWFFEQNWSCEKEKKKKRRLLTSTSASSGECSSSYKIEMRKQSEKDRSEEKLLNKINRKTWNDERNLYLQRALQQAQNRRHSRHVESASQWTKMEKNWEDMSEAHEKKNITNKTKQ